MTPDELDKTITFLLDNFIKGAEVLCFFSDVLTAGTTFKASRAIIQKNTDIYPTSIIGLFIARRVPETPNATIDIEALLAQFKQL